MRNVKLVSRLAPSIFLGGCTQALIGICATMLPYSHARDEITDALSVPAALITQIFYPEGVHTGKGAPQWGIVFLLSGVLFYTAMWFIVISIVTRKRNRRNRGQEYVKKLAG